MRSRLRRLIRRRQPDFNDQTIDPAFVTQALHDGDKNVFDEVEDIDKDGLGPLYNAQSCRECHQNPTSGGASQVVERRAGHRGPAANLSARAFR